MAKKINDNSEFGIKNAELGDGGAAGAANSECGIKNAELGDEGAAGAANSECGIRNSELLDEGAAGTANAELQVGEAAGVADPESGDGMAGGDVLESLDGEAGVAVDLRNYLDELEAELVSERARYLRLAAEYDNFRKRSMKEREMTYSDARADTVTRLLPVYDNLERALKMECEDEAFYRGIEMTMSQLTDIFEKMDITQIPAVGEKFDPNRHNAVMTIENPDLGEKIVAEEFQKGFILGDKVIRFSTVVVAN